MSRPRLLDLFCGAGGAAMGYHRAGFDVVGVDIRPQPQYPFEFHQRDVTAMRPWAVSGFAAAHASPPCQAYSTMSNRWGSDSRALIAETRHLLDRIGVPWVLENVPGARRHLVDPVRLTGEMFGLGVHRPRLFETNWLLMGCPPPPRQTDAAAVYGKNDQRRLWTRTDGGSLYAATLERGRAAMGVDWMGWDELREAIPPAYTEFIGHQLQAFVEVWV